MKSSNTALNTKFFSKNEDYKNFVENLTTYKNVSKKIGRSIRACKNILDMGNGGFINYKISSSVRYLKAVDICIEKKRIEKKSVLTIEYVNGDVLKYTDHKKYDVVIMQNFLHHVVGERVEDNYSNLKEVIIKMNSFLSEKGKLLILESTVPRWFEFVEKIVYNHARYLVPKIFNHPVTFQYSVESLSRILKVTNKMVRIGNIHHGKYQLMYGHLIPVWATPARVVFFEASKKQ